MGDDSLILREDGYIRMKFPVTSLTYHSNLNIILARNHCNSVHVLDVNSGVILQSTCLSSDEEGALGVEYAPGSDRVFVWDSSGVGARTDYNGVLLLHTALQLPLSPSEPDRPIKIELVLSEAVLLYQCLQSLEHLSIEGLTDFIAELRNAMDAEPVRKGVKAQKWSTVSIILPQSTLRLVTTGVVQELKGQNRRIPALAIASAVGQRANELVPCSRDEESRALMYSEAERKETFKRWPHMDYKWALPARMAQAGFYHQPTPSGDDRAMCFTCMVCLVCWEKSDEPWVEHERHSPNCPFVRGEYTHNVPISVSNATACAVPNPGVKVVSKGNTGDLIATGTVEGKVNIWKFACGLKLVKFIQLSPYDSIFSGILPTEGNKVWSTSLQKDSSTYGIELTAMAFIGMTASQETYPQPQTIEIIEKDAIIKPKPSLICALVITRTTEPSEEPIKEDDVSKLLFDSGDKSKESIQAMNDENEAKSHIATSNKMLFLLTYDIHSSIAGSVTTVVHTSNSSGHSKPGGSKKVCTIERTDVANKTIYDEIYLPYSDEETELPQCTKSLIDEQISNVINLNASSSKDDCSMWEPKQIIFTKHFKVLPPPPPSDLLPSFKEYKDFQESNMSSAGMLDFVGKLSQLKSWKSGNLESVGTKLADQTDAGIQADTITHYLSMNGPLEISELKWYEHEANQKVKIATFGNGSKGGTQTAVSNSNNDGFESDPPQEETVSQGVAIQCLSLPNKLNLTDDSKVTHLFPTEDKEHMLVVISTIKPEEVKNDANIDIDGNVKMDVDDVPELATSDAAAYFLLYKINTKSSTLTLDDNPVSVKELPFAESPVDLCLLPIDKNDQYSFATVGIDGCLRLYSLPDFRTLTEKRVPKGHFTSVVYCTSVERMSVSTKHGMIYFYALNNGERDSTGDIDEDEFANIDFEMLQKAPRDEASGPTTAPVIIPNKTELDQNDLETLVALSGSYGTNTTVPYSAVVPGFWCELSLAQCSRSDHQNNRTWRLQNTSSTWDEHVLELTLPYSVSLAHIEFAFTLHKLCSVNLPIIQVTLLKQNLHGIGYKKDATFGYRPDSPVRFPHVDADIAATPLENPVNSEEYLQAHNAEILAGPLLLSSGLDLTQQSGSLILTSPRLFRARGRTFLIHIKTLFDPAKDMNKTAAKPAETSSSKKSGFIGCDWLHQISITVRSSPHTDVPLERQQRIAMLESNSFLNTLLEIATSKCDTTQKKLALDLLIWVISIRLQRLRLTKVEKGKDSGKEGLNPVESQQLECVKIVEKHVDALIKNCILCSKRSIAKKCIKIILITSEGVKQLTKPWKSSFDQTLTTCVTDCIPLLGACDSPGAMRWMVALAQHATSRETATTIIGKCLELLEKTARCIMERSDMYHSLLKARFGLYGLPLERTIFDVEGPVLGKSSATPVTYASVLVGDTAVSAPALLKQECQLKDLLNLASDLVQGPVVGLSPTSPHAGALGGDAAGPAPPQPADNRLLRDMLNTEIDGKLPPSSLAWWSSQGGVGVFGAGLSEAMPLHVTCHVASDGTRLECSGARLHPAAPPAADHHKQLWSVVKESQSKHNSQGPDSLEDVDSASPMECDPQEKMDFADEVFFQDQEQCSIPWSQLVTKPPQHTLVVERMHSGARRFIVLDFGQTVRLTDVIIPSCSDLVTLTIDTWLASEEADSVKLAYATDIATKHLVLTDIQPPPVLRYMKITTIGRYGMSAMKCKIPLGWFYGEIAKVHNVAASLSALNALQQDLSCRLRLATGKLMDLLNPYLELYNGNAAHMMSYLNLPIETDPRVSSGYQECIELQQQLHTCALVVRRLQGASESNERVLDLIAKGKISCEALLETASTDKLRVMSENIVDMLLYFFFQLGDVTHSVPSLQWCQRVTPLLWQCGGHSAASVATLLARCCGAAEWWGAHLADTLCDTFAPQPQPLALHEVLVLVMYMARKSLLSQSPLTGGVPAALAERALALLQAPRPQPALTAAVLTALASALDAVAAAAGHTRWDWVSGGRAGSVQSASGAGGAMRSADCKLHRRKLHKKLLHQMHELEAARRGIQVALEEQQRTRLNLKARMALLGSRAGADGGGGSAATRPPRPVPAPLARRLATALVTQMLPGNEQPISQHTQLLYSKVVGRLCALSGGAGLLDATCVLGLTKLAVSLPPWPRHALTTLLQDLVEYENGTPTSSPSEWGSAGASRGYTQDDCLGKAPRKAKHASVADVLADSFGLTKSSNFNKPKMTTASDPIKNVCIDYQLSQVAESDDSESDEQCFIDALKKETKPKVVIDPSASNISACMDARLESGPEARSEAAARRLLLAGSGALAAAVRAPLPPAPRDPDEEPPPRAHPPLAHTLYDAFRHLAHALPNQMDCSYMENMVSLWLTLNGSSSGSWASVPADAPRVRLASDTVAALLASLATLENVTLRCWVLSMQALAWIASLPLQTEGSNQTMGRVILECEHFVPAIIKFVSISVHSDGLVATSEAYLSGVSIGAGTGAASALHAVLSRVVCGRGAGGALAALRIVSGVWRRDAPAPPAYDLQAALLRVAHPLLQMLSARHAVQALPLIDTVAHMSAAWVCETSGTRGGFEVSSDVRLSGLLADVLGGGGGARRAPLRKTVLAQLMHYCRRLMTCALPYAAQSLASPSRQASSEESQTDESKASQQQQESTNVEDERKQQAARMPCLADTVLQHHEIMHKFYKALMLSDGLILSLSGADINSDGSGSEFTLLKEEVFWLIAQIVDVAANPALVAPSLIDFLKKDEIVNISQAMQQFAFRVLHKPEALAAFIEGGGLELAVEKLTLCHQSIPNSTQGLVSSLMNHLKLPPQLINMSKSAGSKKNQTPLAEAGMMSNGLINLAPLCTVSCGNPTAQAADVLLGDNTASNGPCAARRVRAATWSYHFFSADDASLTLTLSLPFAVQLHEVQMQPHMTSLATCPGAVAIEAGCGGTLAPLGPPQNTSGMTHIKLVLSRPIICTTVQIRLYKPRDSSNMGLLQLRLLGAPAFNKIQTGAGNHNNNWASVVTACCRSRLSGARWAAVTSPGAIAALSALLAGGGSGAAHAHHALLGAARAQPAIRGPLVHSLCNMSDQAYVHAFQSTRGAGSTQAVCSLLAALCRQCGAGACVAYLSWVAHTQHGHLTAPILNTLAEVLWMLKEERLLDNLEDLITDELFELVYGWIKQSPEARLLKKALDSVLCSMCYIRPELYRRLLQHMDIPIDDSSDSMEGLTDDRKVHSSPSTSQQPSSQHSADDIALKLASWQLSTLATAGLSPPASRLLRQSPVLWSAAKALRDFSYATLQQVKGYHTSQEDVHMTNAEESTSEELPSMKMIYSLVEWLRTLCLDRSVKQWLGAEGSVFWRPLLQLLCEPRPPESTWQEGAQFAQLEENTVRLFAEITSCHADNQRLFAATLHAIVESLHCTSSEGISGFTRSLILRLVLSTARVRVAVCWEGVLAGSGAGGAGAGGGRHPAAFAHTLLHLPACTTLRALLRDHRPPPPMPDLEESGKTPSAVAPPPIARRASESAVSEELWELPLAAASASKDKRVKDVKNTTLKQQSTKKRQNKPANDAPQPSALDDTLQAGIRVRVAGINSCFVSLDSTLGALYAATPPNYPPYLTLTLHQDEAMEQTPDTDITAPNTPLSGWGHAILREFGDCGGLALVAGRLPRPHAAPPPPPPRHFRHVTDLDWVKLDEPYEEIVDLGVSCAGSAASEDASAGATVPPHALLALGLLLKLPGYAAALLREGPRAVQLLRLLLGVSHDEDGRSIVVCGNGVGPHGQWSLGTLPFRVISGLLEEAPLAAREGQALRGALLSVGAVRLLLACLAVFTHHKPALNEQNSQASNGSSGKSEEKNQLYWAKGTGFGTGSTQQSWNVEQALLRQRTEELHVTALLQVLASYLNPGEVWPPEDASPDASEPPSDSEGGKETPDAERAELPAEFIDLVAGSTLVPAICSYLRNDSVLDMSRHIPLYVCVLKCARALHSANVPRLNNALKPIPRLLRQMSRTTNSYASKLKMSKKNMFGKMTFSQRFTSSNSSELSEEDEGLATLIADIQVTSAMLCRSDGDDEATSSSIARPISGASREARYIQVMRRLQFETFEMIGECPENGFKFTVPYHFESTVRTAGSRAHPARMKRLAQEAATLATSLPLSYCSSVFVRTDTDRLDVMKVLITGPSDTPYANGCFVLDVYFPAEYPSVPMLINLETTGRRSVRFNPNLYNDGKVCLSVLNTWHGRPEEKWNAHTSSFLQVLVSIQSLILVPEPYFNEPGYERSRGTRVGNNASLEYNSNIYQACVRWAMLDHLRNPSPCFREVIQTHFWTKRNEIAATVAGWITELEAQTGDERTQRNITLNLMALKRHYVKIQEELAKLPVPAGMEDLDEPFRLPTPPTPPPARPPPPPSNEEIDHDMEKIVSQVLD